MAYVDGYVIPVPKARLADYQEMATEAREVWMGLGALDYVECLPDDVPYGELTSFPRAVMAGEEDIVVFAWIVFASRAARDEINRKAMQDPRFERWQRDMPLDGKRMIFGGFVPFVGGPG